MCHRLQRFLKPFCLHCLSFSCCSPSPLPPLSPWMLWPGWSVCSRSWKDSENGTVLQGILVALWNGQLGVGRAAFSGVHSADSFWTVSALFGRGMYAAEQCSCCSPSVSWCPAEPGALEPARVRVLGRSWDCKHLGWCSAGGGHTSCVVPALRIQVLIRFKLSRIWHPDDWGVSERLLYRRKIKGWSFWIGCLLQSCQCSSLITLFFLNISCQN